MPAKAPSTRRAKRGAWMRYSRRRTSGAVRTSSSRWSGSNASTFHGTANESPFLGSDFLTRASMASSSASVKAGVEPGHDLGVLDVEVLGEQVAQLHGQREDLGPGRVEVDRRIGQVAGRRTPLLEDRGHDLVVVLQPGQDLARLRAALDEGREEVVVLDGVVQVQLAPEPGRPLGQRDQATGAVGLGRRLDGHRRTAGCRCASCGGWRRTAQRPRTSSRSWR